MAQLQPIELQRADRIAANHRAFVALGLVEAVNAVNKSNRLEDSVESKTVPKRAARKKVNSVSQCDRVLRSAAQQQLIMASTNITKLRALFDEALEVYDRWDEERLKSVCRTLIENGVTPGDINARVYSKDDYKGMGIVIADAAKLVYGTRADQGPTSSSKRKAAVDVDKDDSDEEDTEVVIVSKKRKKQVKAAEKAPRSEAGRKRVTELVKTWRWDNLKLNPTLKWGEIPDKESEEMAQHIAIEQNKANQSILNDKEALKTYSKKNQGDLLYEWTTDDVIVVMRNSMHNLNKPGVRDAELRRIAEEEAEQAKQTKAALQKLEGRHTADEAGTSATATAAATPSDSATVLSTEVPPASVNPTAAATNVPIEDCDGGKQEQVSQPQQQERQKQQQQSQHPHVSSPVADKEPAGPPPQLDYSQIMQSLEAMTPRTRSMFKSVMMLPSSTPATLVPAAPQPPAAALSAPQPPAATVALTTPAAPTVVYPKRTSAVAAAQATQADSIATSPAEEAAEAAAAAALVSIKMEKCYDKKGSILSVGDRVKLVAGKDEVPAAEGVIADLNLAGGAHWKPSKISVPQEYLLLKNVIVGDEHEKGAKSTVFWLSYNKRSIEQGASTLWDKRQEFRSKSPLWLPAPSSSIIKLG